MKAVEADFEKVLSRLSMSEQEFDPYAGQPVLPQYEAPPPPFEPSPEQLARVAGLKKFNFWSTYLPLGLSGALVVGLVFFMLYLAIFPPYEDTRPFLSGLADSVLILTLLPLVLICGLLQAALIGGIVASRQNRKAKIETERVLQYGRLRVLLWRLEKLLGQVIQQLNPILDNIARAVMRLNEVITLYTTRLMKLIKKNEE